METRKYAWGVEACIWTRLSSIFLNICVRLNASTPHAHLIQYKLLLIKHLESQCLVDGKDSAGRGGISYEQLQTKLFPS